MRAPLVDGQTVGIQNYRNWQVHIAHVPQSIYLSDSSIQENIAFGLPCEKIDAKRVRQVGKQAQIDDIIESWLKNTKQRWVSGECGCPAASVKGLDRPGSLQACRCYCF